MLQTSQGVRTALVDRAFSRLYWLVVLVPYRDLLGGFTNLAPLYAFIVGVLLHFASEKGDRPRFYVRYKTKQAQGRAPTVAKLIDLYPSDTPNRVLKT